ncbi:Vacuolar protein sorting-associated protein 54 [Aphelenchoides bicaudatus]|nr:Vacuolar protein sorting-associated protein 54 [Aphelenchoides bicaudatus]
MRRQYRKLTMNILNTIWLRQAKKHRQYLKSKRSLRRVLALHNDQSKFTINDVPSLFLTSDFSLRDPETFEAVFLEPQDGEIDRIFSETELRSSLSGDGRIFRPYNNLQNRLELYDDVVSALLNTKLEDKSENFWKTVNSYGSLNEDLGTTLQSIRDLRSNLGTVKTAIYDRSKHILQLNNALENRKKLLQRLEDIACLRDAQTTVQMLLNQNDFPRALECIETAQEVLTSDLRGVVCFRHLNSQLNELHRAIGKMLLEEFVTLIQREFGKPIERENECFYQETQLDPVIHGLLRCDEYKFLGVLRQEIVEAVKNTIRQIVKNRLVECEAMIPDYDPALSLGEQMRRMNYSQWLETLSGVFDSLFFLCCRVVSIQELIMENVERVESLQRFRVQVDEVDSDTIVEDQKNLKANMSFTSLDMTTNNTLLSSEPSTPTRINAHDSSTATDSSLDTSNEAQTGNHLTNHTTPIHRNESSNSVSHIGNGSLKTAPSGNPSQSSAINTLLTMSCRTLSQLKTVVPYLVDHTIISVEERVSKRLTTKYKDKFLERCSPENFSEFEALVRRFVRRCRTLSRPESSLALSDTHEQLTATRSPLIAAVQLQTTKFITCFHEMCTSSLAQLLDHEQWKPAEVPNEIQKIVDEYMQTGKLRFYSTGSLVSSSRTSPEPPTTRSEPGAEALFFGDEKFIVVGACLSLFKMIAKYCTVLAYFPQYAPEVLMHLITLLKSFNSRTCQLILGAGALQMLIGLKTISVKTLALSARCLQLVVHIIPSVKKQFVDALGDRDQNQGRHFDTTLRDYNDHVEEIFSKLITVVDQHLITGLSQWDLKSGTPSTAFHHIVKQIGKFYNGFSTVMPPKVTTEMLHRIHAEFKVKMADQMIKKQITPHDSLNYGLANSEFQYYLENMRAFPDCLYFPEDSIASLPI